ncbi:hypothetical protein E2C01_032806 [Portunus trituberculatus]|uniref:Secreted protein n=1 Tax=Portunus trituberculatus TaxID=210409 RepID=A0A5B7F0L0_PORTR|nr:hypothetical protein [Portunus trituberculatus]
MSSRGRWLAGWLAGWLSLVIMRLGELCAWEDEEKLSIAACVGWLAVAAPRCLECGLPLHTVPVARQSRPYS